MHFYIYMCAYELTLKIQYFSMQCTISNCETFKSKEKQRKYYLSHDIHQPVTKINFQGCFHNISSIFFKSDAFNNRENMHFHSSENQSRALIWYQIERF